MKNTKEMEVNGIDTIRETTSKPPMEIEVSYNVQYSQQVLMQGWNLAYIAIILYCYICKVPLVWHTYPQGNVIFHCTNCNRKWIKGEGWKKNE